GLVVHPGEMEGAVHDGLAQVLGVLGAYDDVSEFARAGGDLRLVDRKGQHVRRTALSAVLLVELRDAPRVDELDRDVAVLHACRRERDPEEALDLGRRRGVRAPVADDLHVEQGAQARRRSAGRSAGRSSGAARSACSLYASTIRWTRRWRTTSAPPKRTNST